MIAKFEIKIRTKTFHQREREREKVLLFAMYILGRRLLCNGPQELTKYSKLVLMLALCFLDIYSSFNTSSK
jgi:hypothetical protein